ncbi:YesL family protein [Salibacterium halotolerans]|uniref:Uncharacterized membrane protein YesL n=1 Tax=Salibacterium halotolerans TaxID=1884432 RepID=A0A1I5PRN9_9BACI|nr:YesL family protein [Salibacterium halotolerans]SFP36683.1 Uncharacterized membrane protein YesL [Salibacterium halotolerans]
MSSMGYGLLRVPEWVLRFAYLNVLWVVFTMTGLIVFGVFPAARATLSVAERWLRGETDFSVFRTFWRGYKTNFVQSNVLGFLIVVTGAALYLYFLLIQQIDGPAVYVLQYVLLLVSTMYVLTMLYMFPVSIRHDAGILSIVKTSFLVMLVSPLSTLMTIAGIFIMYLLVMYLPGLLPVFGASASAFLLMWSSEIAFSNIERKKEKQLPASKAG